MRPWMEIVPRVTRMRRCEMSNQLAVMVLRVRELS